MNKYILFKFRNFLGSIITLILIQPFFLWAQSNNISTPTKSQILSQQELDAINRQPIAQVVSAKEGVQGPQKRNQSFLYQEDDGTKVQEFRDVGQQVEIQVDSNVGTHYQMSPPLDRDVNTSRQTINRVPSVSLPF
jgi:hypothetical protein